MEMFVLILPKNFILEKRKRKSLHRSLNKPLRIKEESYSLPAKTRAPAPDGFMGELYSIFRGEMISIFYSFFQRIEVERTPL